MASTRRPATIRNLIWAKNPPDIMPPTAVLVRAAEALEQLKRRRRRRRSTGGSRRMRTTTAGEPPPDDGSSASGTTEQVLDGSMVRSKSTWFAR